MLGAIKLAWWRESLEKLDHEPAPQEPRLQAAAEELLPRGISGADLASLEESWALILMKSETELFLRGVAVRGPRLFELAGRMLGVAMDDALEELAWAFGAADLARRGVFDVSGVAPGRWSVRMPLEQRPLAMLGVLGRRDLRRGAPFEPEATPGRAWALLRHRLTGRL